MVTVSELWQYPFKSAKGNSLPFIEFDEEGVIGDRRLVALDDKGVFITARKYPQLLQLLCTATDNGWLLQHPNAPDSYQLNSCELSLNENSIKGQLWRDELNAIDAGKEVATWLSHALKLNVSIALWQKHARVSGKYQLETNFCDAAPLLITSQESLNAVSKIADITPDIRRFRSNIVLSGCEEFAEEDWQQLKIGQVTFELLDTCVRCILTTRDPDTGEADSNKQPLRALKQSHNNEQGQPIFGVNAKLLLPLATNTKINVGDEVFIS